MQHLTADEVKLIAIAAVQGKAYIDVDFHGTPTPCCGSCGRLIHHPDCSQLRMEREDAAVEAADERGV